LRPLCGSEFCLPGNPLPPSSGGPHLRFAGSFGLPEKSFTLPLAF